MRIVTIVGARPQFVKAAIVSKAIFASNIEEIIVHTGQHYDHNMSELFFDELNIPKPHFHLGINEGSHGQQTGRMLESIEKVLLGLKPSCILIYGDTNSTLAGALAAAKLHIPIAHVESGLRSFNNKMPEEINRIVADKISSFLFTPTDTATKNLLNEGINLSSIFQVGDVMYDVSLFYEKYAKNKANIMAQLSLEEQSYILATIHRAENTNDITRLKNIFEYLKLLSKKYKVIVPLHPRTKQALLANKLFHLFENVLFFIEPVGYLDMVKLEKHSFFIVTDSGGIQKEAFFYQKPCITLRDETEWVEIVEAGWNIVVSPENNFKLINEQVEEFISNFNPIVKSFYGDGNSAGSIVKILLEKLN